MNDRIKNTFETLNRTALVTFITAGDPDHTTSLEVLKGLPEAGADIIELGMPFTDPMADGPAIQEANQRALAAGANMKQTFSMVKAFREENNKTPIILMGYYNPILQYDPIRFVNDCADIGVDGLIIVDLPPEEDEALRGLAADKGVEIIRLITPTTNEQRLPKVLEGAGGFLYYVSITGVTGAAKPDPQKVKAHLDQLRRFTDLPTAIGFGIKTPEDAKKMSEAADAVVVGSAIIERVKAVHDGSGTVQDVLDYISTLSESLSGSLSA